MSFEKKSSAPAHGAPTLTVCFIVRDEALYIVDALASIKELADEILVIDSGSQDATPTLVKGFDPKILFYERTWPNSFSDQKNFALSQATGDWILFLDADERVFESDHSKIRHAIEDPAVFAYNLEIRNYTRLFQQFGFRWNRDNNIAPGYYITHLHRLFRRDPRIRYQGKLHERIEPSLQKAQLKTGDLPVTIHHLGPLKEEDQALSKKRYSFYAQLGEEKIIDEPSDSQAYWELGVVYQKLGRHEEALQKFEEACRLSPDTETFELYRAMTLFHLQRWEALRSATSEAREIQFFKTVAIAQTDPSFIDRILEFSDLFVQAPLLQYELLLRYGFSKEAEAARAFVTEQFGSTGWPQALEALHARQRGDSLLARKRAEESWAYRCPLGLQELLILELQDKHFDRIKEIQDTMSEADKNRLKPDTLKLFEVARKLSLKTASPLT